MITLYQFAAGYGLPSTSPFCIKLEAFLRFADVEYRSVEENDPRKGPKGKIPFIDNGQSKVGDSGLIIDQLKQQGVDLDAHLSSEQKAVAHALRTMVEERLYWVTTYSRFMEDDNRKKIFALLATDMPPVISSLVPRLIYKQVVKDLHAQGLGRHDRDTVYALGISDLQALSDYLADKPFMMGEQLSSVDATVFGFVSAILWTMPSPLRGAAWGHENLVAYARRLRESYFSDFPEQV